MTKEIFQDTYNSYLSAYGDIGSSERERVLRQCVTDDVVSILPNEENHGLIKLLQHIEQFQQKRPGSYFKSNKLSIHHAQFLAELTLYSKDGSAIATAHTYGRCNEQGLITYLIGFF